MFKTLLDNVARAAQAVVNTPNLPPTVEGLRAHAAAFQATIAPQLGAMAEQVAAFAQVAIGEGAKLKPDLDAWRDGKAEARAAILRAVTALYGSLSTAMNQDQAAFRSLSGYRDQILADQRTVAGIMRELSAQIAALQDQLRDGRERLDSERQRLAVLQAIPFPLPWMIAEIASLIGSGQTLEQRLSNLYRQQSELQGQAASVDHAAGAVQGLAGQLSVLETGAQNLLNFVSVSHGNMLQTKHSLEGSQGGATPILVEAYLDTLKAQSQQILTYLSQG